MIKELTEQLSHGNNLTIDQMTSVMDEILTGTQSDENVAEFLKNLTEKGESDDELLAMLNKMEEYSLQIFDYYLRNFHYLLIQKFFLLHYLL